MLWNKGKVWPVHGGQNEEALVAGPPPVSARKRRHGMILFTVLNLSILMLCGTIIMLGRRESVPRTESPAAVPAVVQAPKSKHEIEPAPVVLVPATESLTEPVRNVRTRVTPAPEVEPEPEPARVVQAQPVDEENYWHDERVYEEVFRFKGQVGLIRNTLIELRKTFPSGTTMWSERGPGNSVDIHIECDQEHRRDLPVLSQTVASKAWEAGGCDVGRAFVRSGLKQAESLHATVHPPGAFLVER
jgi:hypothetical protein